MNFAFVLALGRSGTQFLARMFQHDERAAVYHEPYNEDAIIMNLRYAGFNHVADKKMATRFVEMTRRSADSTLHIETNSYLRYETTWLRTNLDASLIHLVRDARTYLPSAFIRDVYTPNDIQQPIVPHDDSPYAEKWGTMSRFEKICWYWTHTNSMLAGSIQNHVHMEDLLTDYQALYEMILTPFGLNLDQTTWESEVKRPMNTKGRYRLRRTLRGLLGRAPNSHGTTLPPFERWTKEQQKSFHSICGETMERLGYKL